MVVKTVLVVTPVGPSVYCDDMLVVFEAVFETGLFVDEIETVVLCTDDEVETVVLCTDDEVETAVLCIVDRLELGPKVVRTVDFDDNSVDDVFIGAFVVSCIVSLSSLDLVRTTLGTVIATITNVKSSRRANRSKTRFRLHHINKL